MVDVDEVDWGNSSSAVADPMDAGEADAAGTAQARGVVNTRARVRVPACTRCTCRRRCRQGNETSPHLLFP